MVVHNIKALNMQSRPQCSSFAVAQEYNNVAR